MTFETRLEVRYPDCDSMGIVHHAVYPIWYEMARMDVFEKCGFGYSHTHALGIDPAMVHLELNYGAPVSYPAAVTVKTHITLCEGKKLGFRYEIIPNGQESAIASASSFHIWVKDGKAYHLETEQPEIFSAYRAALETV